MREIDTSAGACNHRRCQNRDTGSIQTRPATSGGGALQLHSGTPTRVTLTPAAPAPANDNPCYSSPRLRMPRDVNDPVAPAPSRADHEQDDDSTKDVVNAANIAIQKISTTTIQHIIGAVFNHDKDRLPAPSAEQSGLEHLAASGRDVAYVLQRQPHSQAALLQAFQNALQRAWPTLSPAPDPDHIYVTQYAEHEVPSSAPHPVFSRTVLFSQTLTAALLASANTAPANYDQTRTGFFRQPDNADAGNEIAQMKGARNLLTFEKILQDATTASARHHQFRQHLRQFWNSPDPTLDGEQTPRTRLAREWGEQRLTEARLRISDGTLTAADQQWLTDIAENRLAEHPPGAFSVSLQDGAGSIPLSGILVVTQSPDQPPDSTAGRVLLAIPGQGVLAYASAAAYRQGLQQLFDATSQRDILLTRVAQAERQRAANLDNEIAATSPFRYQPISGPVMLDRVQSVLDQQARDITWTALSGTAGRSASSAALDQAADLSATSDIAGMLNLRQQLILEKFLQAASETDRAAWFDELKAYQAALQKTQTGGFPAMWQFLDTGFLQRYARDDIRARIRHDLQLDIDPDRVIVTTYSLSLPHTTRGDLPAPPQARKPEKIPSRMTLTELALANTRMLDLSWGNEFPVTDSDGKSLPQLTRNYLTQTIRAANIGQRYQEFLQSRLLDSPEGIAREQSYTQFLKAQMQLDVREAKISGDITSESAHWVLAALKGSPCYANNEVVRTRNVAIGGQQLNGILAFATPVPLVTAIGLFPVTMQAGIGSSKIVMYTPDAPDGKRLREYENRKQMMAGFINNPLMRDYLLQRIETGHQHEVGKLLADGVSACNFRQPPVPGNFLHSAYRNQVRHLLADADARTTTNSEAGRQAWWDKFDTALDIAGIILPLRLSLPLSLLRAGYAFYSSSDARRRGDDDAALIELVNGISQLGGAVSDSFGVSMHQAGKLYRAGIDKQPRNPAGGARISAVPPLPSPANPVPAGMTTVQIDGLTHYYWYTKNTMVRYRDLFVWDPSHPGLLKSAGYGAPDADNVWRKISPLKGGNDSLSPSAAAADISPLHQPEPASPAQPVIRKTMTAGGRGHFFSININGRERDVGFNLEKNAFHEINETGAAKDPGWYVLRNNEMRKRNPAHRVTNDERVVSLKALGIELALPLAIPGMMRASSIPRIIRSVWIGDRVIPEALVKNLGRNAFNATLGKKPYKTKLYLSNHHPLNFQKNLAALKEYAPLVDVITLEDSRFYRNFRSAEQGKYFAQYQTALNGNGGVAANNASAADIMRYQLLFRKGGLYMDIDDKLRPLGVLDIKTTPAGLALNGPVSNSTLGMDAEYNTSIFGTQKNNPTLRAISEESYRRFLENRDLYVLPRPRKSTHSEQQISDYMKRVSYVTGPDVFNKVVNERLPDMYQLREAIRLRADSSIEIPDAMKALIDEWLDSRLPLNDVNQIGNAHTWEEYR